LEDLSVDGEIISEWILGKQGGRLWTGFICLRIMMMMIIIMAVVAQSV
jgi:hypothetical protein